MHILKTTGEVVEVPYVNYRSITAGVNENGSDDPFTTVPLPEGLACGYSVYANDNGLMTGMQENEAAELLCAYAPLVGPVVVVSFEESKEEDLVGEIEPEARKNFQDRLALVLKAMAERREAQAKFRAAREN